MAHYSVPILNPTPIFCIGPIIPALAGEPSIAAAGPRGLLRHLSPIRPTFTSYYHFTRTKKGLRQLARCPFTRASFVLSLHDRRLEPHRPRRYQYHLPRIADDSAIASSGLEARQSCQTQFSSTNLLFLRHFQLTVSLRTNLYVVMHVGAWRVLCELQLGCAHSYVISKFPSTMARHVN